MVIAVLYAVATVAILLLGPGCVLPKPTIDCRILGCGPDAVCVMDDSQVEVKYVCQPIPEPSPPPVLPPTPPPVSPPVPPPEPPPPTPVPTPTPAPTCSAVELTANEVQGPAQLQGKVKAAISEMGDPTGIDPGITLRTLAAKLCTGGLYAFAGEEAIFVKRVDGLYEEYHAVYFGTGGWTDSGNGKFVGLHRLAGEAPPEPPPVVTDLCPATPCPLRTYEDGRPHWQYNAKQHTMGNADSTPIVIGQLSYCEAIGMSPMADGTPRASCPVRPDGHPDRVIVEGWLLEGGPTRDSRNGQDCTPNNTDNPAAFLFGTGNCRVCNTPKTVCSQWF